MNKTNIQYLNYTWNPISMRCNAVSDGCMNCWHMRMAHRMANNPVLNKRRRAAYAGEDPILNLTELVKPLRKHNARIGVQFMGDLFHPNVTDEFIHGVFSIMFDCESIKQTGNTFFILTKRPERMFNFMRNNYSPAQCFQRPPWNNIWFGVSVENQETADKRIPILLQCPVKNRWISAEPLLGPVDLTTINVLQIEGRYPFPQLEEKYRSKAADYLDWVVCGAETGPGARPMEWDWAISLANQCKSANMPFFFKEPWKNAPHNCRRRELPDEVLK